MSRDFTAAVVASLDRRGRGARNAQDPKPRCESGMAESTRFTAAQKLEVSGSRDLEQVAPYNNDKHTLAASVNISSCSLIFSPFIILPFSLLKTFLIFWPLHFFLHNILFPPLLLLVSVTISF